MKQFKRKRNTIRCIIASLAFKKKSVKEKTVTSDSDLLEKTSVTKSMLILIYLIWFCILSKGIEHGTVHSTLDVQYSTFMN